MTTGDGDDDLLGRLSLDDLRRVLTPLEERQAGKLRSRPYAIGRLRRALARAGITLGAAVDAAGVGRPPPDAEPLDEAGWMALLERSGAEAWETLLAGAGEIEALLARGRW
jgi:hypothetical protein